MNLKGIFVENGLTDMETDIERSMVDFAYYYGISSLKTYNNFSENCPHLTDLLTEFVDNNNTNKDSNDGEPILSDGGLERIVTKKCNEIRRIIAEDYQGLDIEGIANLGRKCNMKNTIKYIGI